MNKQFFKKLNATLFKLLKKSGDPLTEKREFTHWFYFEKQEDLEKMEQYAYDIGFHTVKKEKGKLIGKDFLLVMGIEEKPNLARMDFDYMEFYKKAAEYNGKYDGWETSLEN